MFFSILAISIGASMGAVLRWGLSNQFNAIVPNLPMGTLAANLTGGYLIGVAVAFFSNHPHLPPQWRLLIVTGFLGGLTTFSTFSSEVVAQLMAGRFGWAAATALVHVLGSLCMTFLGIGTVGLFRSAA
ncbi:MAG: fluoride efflux transporter CrcB [Brachymonas sp.]|nr:fluoride efflux transporter CrcB [Brachymonas sp.]